MKFTFVNKDEEKSLSAVKLIKDKYLKEGHQFVDKDPDVVFSIGGDGTFLRAVNTFYDCNPIFIGINKGNLGYLLEFSLEDILDKNFRIENKEIQNIRLLECELNSKTYYALNEFRIESYAGTSIKFEVYFNNKLFESLRSDGVIVSSSIGSTGISKSYGGTIIDPKTEVLQFLEKGPLHSKVYHSLCSPLILNNETKIVFKNFNLDSFYLNYDYLSLFITKIKSDIKISYSNKYIRMLRNSDDFIEKVKGSFVG